MWAESLFENTQNAVARAVDAIVQFVSMKVRVRNDPAALFLLKCFTTYSTCIFAEEQRCSVESQAAEFDLSELLLLQ